MPASGRCEAGVKFRSTKNRIPTCRAAGCGFPSHLTSTSFEPPSWRLVDIRWMGESEPTNPGHCIDFLNRNTSQVRYVLMDTSFLSDASRLPPLPLPPSGKVSSNMAWEMAHEEMFLVSLDRKPMREVAPFHVQNLCEHDSNAFVHPPPLIMYLVVLQSISTCIEAPGLHRCRWCLNSLVARKY